jgi:RNA polymerase sigma-70 factor (ECF subfamily)
VLIRREVLLWTASEVAELLGTTVASVNSALQRARATLSEQELAQPGPGGGPASELDADQQEFLARYADAFERYDVGALVQLLHEDAILNMPPYDIWLQGIQKWWVGPGAPCRGSKLQPLSANGMPAFAQWRPNPDGDGYYAWALQVLELKDQRIVGYTAFLDVDTLFPMWGMPLRLDRDGQPIPA